MSKYDNGLKYDFKIENGGLAYDYKLYQLIINLFEGIYVNDDSKELVTYLLKTERVTLQDALLSMAYPTMTDSLRTTDSDGLSVSALLEHLESIGLLQDFAYLLATISIIDNNLNLVEELNQFAEIMLQEDYSVTDFEKQNFYEGTEIDIVSTNVGYTYDMLIKGSLSLVEGEFSNISGDLVLYCESEDGDTTDSITFEDIELNSIGEVYDYIFIGNIYQWIGKRDYEDGDEDLEDVVTDYTSTYYLLDTPIITSLERTELKIETATIFVSTIGTENQPYISFYTTKSQVELMALASKAEELGFTEVQSMLAFLNKLEVVGISDLDEPKTATSDYYIGTDDTMDGRFNTWLSPFDMLVDPRQSSLGIMPPVEHTQIDLPYTDGSIFQDAKYTNRIFNLVTYSMQGLSAMQKETLKAQIVELLANTKTEPKRLTFSSNSLTFDVRYSGEVGFEEAPSWIKAEIPFEAQPYGYKQFAEEVNGDGIIVNDGHADLGVKVEIRDGCVIPNFTIGGTEFTWDGTVPSGNKLVIDNEDKTCYLVDALGNKTQALQKLTDGSSFRTIPKGTQAVVQCLNDSTRSHLHIEYQPKYLWKGADLIDE